MKYVTAGESHGPSLVAIVSGVPAGVAISSVAINDDLARRQRGYGRGGRMAIETDTVRILSGLRFGSSLGTPIALQIDNKDWANWSVRMALEGQPPDGLVLEQSPRPGHADLVGALKNDAIDCRNILERASARETAARVAAGAVAKAVLAAFGVEVYSYVTRIGGVTIPQKAIESVRAVFPHDDIESSAVRCPDETASSLMLAAIDEAKAAGLSLGGCFNVIATGLVPGVGGFAEGSDRLTGRIGGALFSIPAIKGVEFGLGFKAAALPGNLVHDAIICSLDDARSQDDARSPGDTRSPDDTRSAGETRSQDDARSPDDIRSQDDTHPQNIGKKRIQPVRATNNAGGLEGGMTTGEPLVVHAAMKPIPTMQTPLATVDLVTFEARAASKERGDVCAVPAAAVVAEAEVALVLADAYLDKFGHDVMSDSLRAFESYVARITR